MRVPNIELKREGNGEGKRATFTKVRDFTKSTKLSQCNAKCSCIDKVSI